MAHAKLLQIDAAKERLAEAVADLEKNPPTDWQDRVCMRYLRAEAEAVVRAAAAGK